MRKLVSEAWLKDEIAAHMSQPEWDPTKFWTRPERCARKGNGPNWRYSFNLGAVPHGFVKRWEAIQKRFEDSYDLVEG